MTEIKMSNKWLAVHSEDPYVANPEGRCADSREQCERELDAWASEEADEYESADEIKEQYVIVQLTAEAFEEYEATCGALDEMGAIENGVLYSSGEKPYEGMYE